MKMQDLTKMNRKAKKNHLIQKHLGKHLANRWQTVSQHY